MAVEAKSTRQPTVYVVDDDHQLGEMTAAILETEGLDILFFADPRLALKACNEAAHKPDVLVTDYVMGPMNGLQLVQSVRLNAPGIRTILLSGTVSEGFIRKQSIKPDFFMSKPYQPNELVQRVRSLLNGK